VVALAIALSIPVPGCSRRQPAAAVAPPDHVYTVRGRITGLPKKDNPLSELTIWHEAVPNFVRQDGTLGMDSMEMPFTPAPGVALEGLAVGDPVEFTFEVRWKGRPGSQLTRVRKLPEGTVLDLAKPGS